MISNIISQLQESVSLGRAAGFFIVEMIMIMIMIMVLFKFHSQNGFFKIRFCC